MAETEAAAPAAPAGGPVTFQSLGIRDELCEACADLGFKEPTPIQREAIPLALAGRDVIGLAQTGSGKTAAFGLPILQALLGTAGQKRAPGVFACIMAPTRELCFQIAEHLEALGSRIGVKCAVVVGGVDMLGQAIALAKNPHVVVGTPGRLVDHLEHTKGFHLRNIRFLVMDEADRLLDMDFEEEINKILAVVAPRDQRQTFLFSATMTSKVAKLQRASLTSPAKVEVSTKYTTVDTLIQQYVFIPAKFKDCYLTYILNEMAGNTIVVFVHTCSTAQRLALMLRTLGFSAVPLHGQMSQPKRLGALNKFKAGARNILIATDVASRGLDIPTVDCVYNYDVPQHGKDYVHRVGRAARAGRSGRALTFVTQYDVEQYQRIEQMIGKRLDAYPVREEDVLLLQERVGEAARLAAKEAKEQLEAHRHRGKRSADDADDAAGAEDNPLTRAPAAVAGKRHKAHRGRA